MAHAVANAETEPSVKSAAQEWRAHWHLALAATAGFTFAALPTASMGLFMDPLSHELGFSRAEISSGLTIYALIAIPFSPFIGAAIDRWGGRRLAVLSMILAAIGFAAFSLAGSSLTLWLALWTFYAFAALGIRATVWTAAISGTFSAGRGLALGVTLSGSAITMALAPSLTRWMIVEFGWRQAYLWLGLGWGGAVAAILSAFFFDSRNRDRCSASEDIDPLPVPAVTGLTLAEALRDGSILRIAASTLIGILAVAALNVHQVPILVQYGFSRENAALLAGVAGVANVVGHLLTGWLLDRGASWWFGPTTMALPAVSCALFLTGQGGFPALIAILCLGYASGSVTQVSSYLCGQFGGLRHYGKIFGVISSLIALGMGIGPLVGGLIFDRSGSYGSLLTAGIPIGLISSLLIVRLGTRPRWEAAGFGAIKQAAEQVRRSEGAA